MSAADDTPARDPHEANDVPSTSSPVDDVMSPADRLADSEVAVTRKTRDPLEETDT